MCTNYFMLFRNTVCSLRVLPLVSCLHPQAGVERRGKQALGGHDTHQYSICVVRVCSRVYD